MNSPGPSTQPAEPVVFVFHPDDSALRLLPDGTHVIIQRKLPLPASQTPAEGAEFTDTARSALLWVLWHHQGGSSKVGQAMRFALGMGQFERLGERRIAEAKRWAEPHPHLAHESALAATEQQAQKIKPVAWAASRNGEQVFVWDQERPVHSPWADGPGNWIPLYAKGQP
jgi:hypothetical protein